MTTLPIRRIILYKHGVGYFERRGEVSGEEVRLSFARPAMDDVLKSLVALDLGAGQVLSVDFETPEDRAALLAKGSINLSSNHSMLDLVRDLRGRQVRLLLTEHYEDEGDTLEGLVVGIEYEAEEPLKRAAVALYQANRRVVRQVPLKDILHLELLDSSAAADLDYFLRAAQSEEERRSATLHLSSGDHDVLVGYIAPAPAWRVSYRMLYETAEPEGAASVLLQGWGLFDNQLEEDLDDIHLTLVAGMPVSFRYRLYEPHTPERPLVADEERTVNAPVFFEGAPPPAPAPQKARTERARAAAFGGMADMAMAEIEEENMADAEAFSLSADDMAGSVQAAATGGERGALFAYEVSHPVSVSRGQSAMVPILSQRIGCQRELLYNGRKLPEHPVASLRLDNETGLTLERGPVTVLEDGGYAGEAVVPFTQTGAELIVPFAVELGIKVEEKHRSERHMVSIAVRGEYLHIQEYDIRHTEYHLTSTLARQVKVTIEHLLRQQYDFYNMLEPRETSASFARWDVACAASTRTVFDVRERRLTMRHEQVHSLTGKKLQTYLENRLLDATTVKELEDVLGIYRQIQELQRQIQELGNERNNIYRQQKQIQGNLGPLGREGDERVLRARYVNTLNQLEDRLTALDNQEQRLKQQIEELQQQARQRLEALTQQG